MAVPATNHPHRLAADAGTNIAPAAAASDYAPVRQARNRLIERAPHGTAPGLPTGGIIQREACRSLATKLQLRPPNDPSALFI
jgi:hypothetical protein